MEDFKRTEKLKECYSNHSDIHYLDSSINISLPIYSLINLIFLSVLKQHADISELPLKYFNMHITQTRKALFLISNPPFVKVN